MLEELEQVVVFQQQQMLIISGFTLIPIEHFPEPAPEIIVVVLEIVLSILWIIINLPY